MHKERQKCLPYPQTKMAHCPQYVQKYNSRGMVQDRQNVRECSPKLGWQTLFLKNKSKDKENNEGCLPQALSLMSSARLVTRDYNHYESIGSSNKVAFTSKLLNSKNGFTRCPFTLKVLPFLGSSISMAP
jgi:hypothetical protein